MPFAEFKPYTIKITLTTGVSHGDCKVQTQESLANAEVSARQQCVYKGP